MAVERLTVLWKSIVLEVPMNKKMGRLEWPSIPMNTLGLQITIFTLALAAF